MLDVPSNSEASARAVWSASPDGLRITDARGRILDVNESYCKLVGQPREALIGNLFTGSYRECDRAAMLEGYRRTFRDRPPRGTRRRKHIHLADGRSMVVEITISFIKSADEPALLTIYRDVADLERSEQELERRARQQATVAELGQQALRDRDYEGLLRETVGRVAETLAVDHCAVLELQPGGEWLITRAAVGFDDEIANRTLSSTRRTHAGYALESGAPCILEDLGSDVRFTDSELLGKHGVKSGVTVIITGSGRPFGTLAVYTTVIRSFNRDDIHFLQAVANVLATAIERRRAEEKLERALATAKEATALKNRFLANLSHEIRTPMNGILGTTELMLATSLNPEQREYGEVIRTSTETLLAVINDIVDLSRIEAGKIELESVVFDPVQILEEVLALLAVRARAKGLAVSCAIEGEIPHRVLGDPGRLRQVLINVVGNAVKFTRSGSVVATVCLEANNESAAGIRFSVRDTGIGIGLEDQARLFQSFSQIDDTATRRHGGTGVGLAIAKQLVELMGGAIGVQSEPGKGSTFWFTARFQAAGNGLPEAVRPKPVRSANGPSRLRSSRRILLAEDNPVNRKVALRILQQAGLVVDAVTNGREVLEALDVRPYDVVLMDVQMPEMDGLQATRAIRSLEDGRRRIPVLAMTANAMCGDRELCLEAGMDDYISKPVRPEELRGAVLRWLDPKEMPA